MRRWIVALAVALPVCVVRASGLSQAQQSGGGQYMVVDTGQERCYDSAAQIQCPEAGRAFAGQDAQTTRNPPSYAVSADGLTVTDRNTGLTWQRSPDTTGDGALTAADKLTWPQARARPGALSAAGYGGFRDWRLPSIQELYSLIDFRGTDPAVQGSDTRGLTPFIDTDYFAFAYGDTRSGERVIDSQYASSTLYVANSEMLFGVNFADGRIKGYGLTMRGAAKTFFVLCVRGNPDYGRNRFLAGGDGTVTDAATGLMWAQADSGSAMDWQAALAWAAAMNAAGYMGHHDWRLPNVKELQSLVDYTRSPDTTGSAAIDALFDVTPIVNEAGRPDFPSYWTSTTHASANGSGAAAAYVAFGRAMGYMDGAWRDVHGAGAQRSDPKAGDPVAFPRGRGPQGDAVRILNHVRLVRTTEALPMPTETTGATRTATATATPAATADEPPEATNTATATGQPAGWRAVLLPYLTTGR